MNSRYEPNTMNELVSNTRKLVSEEVVNKVHLITDFVDDDDTTGTNDECFLNISN